MQPIGLVRGLLGTRHRWQADALERELHVLGRHLAKAVGEHQPGLEPELDRCRRGLLYLSCCIEFDFGGIRLGLHQALVDHAHHVAVDRSATVRRIDQVKVLHGPNRQQRAYRSASLRQRDVGPQGAAHACRARAGHQQIASCQLTLHIKTPRLVKGTQ